MQLPLKVTVLNFFRKLFQFPILEGFLASLTRGKPPGHFFCKFVPNPYQYKKPTFREFKSEGISMRADISDYVGHYYFFGFRDGAQTELFSKCKRHFNVLDIGSNIGFTLLKLAQQAIHGKVIGFEPDFYNFSCCEHNLNLNDLSNVTLLNVGLGSADADLALEARSPNNRGGNRISPIGSKNTIQVPVRKLDSIFASLSLNQLHLMKIDVEGYELRVLRGAEETLKRYKPMLFIEIDNDNLLDQGDSAEMLIDFLIQLGYQSIVTAESKQPIKPGFNFAHCHFDVIAE